MLQPTRHSAVTSTYCSVDHQAVCGDAAQAVPVTDGSINSRQTTTFYLQTSGGVLSTVVTVGRRYGSCRLRDNNNILNVSDNADGNVSLILSSMEHVGDEIFS